MNQLAPAPGDSATDFTGDESEQRLREPLEDTIELERDSSSVLDDLHGPAGVRAAQAAKTPTAPVERPRWLLILLISYASALTIGLVYLLATSAGRTARELENLPDVAPLKEGEFRYAPQDAALPRAHRLKLGDSRRFGHILVEPLRVERGVVEFTHFSGQPHDETPPSVAALKLWVRFTNVSADQWIAPLDQQLLFKRDYLDQSDAFLANCFLTPEGSPSNPATTIWMLDHPPTSSWNLLQQQLGARLKPGESVETFLPTHSDGIEDVQGPLRWRMHIRKGYHAATGHGVTTLVDVVFDAREIVVNSSDIGV